MMKTIRTFTVALAAAALLPLAAASAQGAAFGKGSKILDLGIVTDPTGVGAGLEIGVLELAPNLTLGVGGAASYQSQSSFGVDVSTTWLAGVANVHYALPNLPALDLFGGASLGIFRASVDAAGLGSASDSELGFGINLGARYMLTDKLGGVVRLGIEDAPELFLGLSIKF
jgi:hypothetical protein